MRAAFLYAGVTAILLACNGPRARAERYAVLPRQDTSPSATPAASTSAPASKSSDEPASTNTRSSSAAVSNSPSPSGAASSTASAAKSLNSASGTIHSTSDASAAASTFAVVTASPIPKGSFNITSTNDTVIEGLPVKPQITPGLSVAGALMILTGAFYTIVGIKTKWLHISLSSAYLVSLAVTVLILYVMHPPVSNGLQGGYVAAAMLPGAILGGLAIVFKDITEGFACFLGGFCLSMWFLVLKPGGLISNDVGKVIFIACLTVGAFPLYLSHHTRPYGLIGSVAFGGATVVVLGIDCFSRAGLKEFWLYIWGLNDDIFPLHYHQPYPITRGIRVEIAAIIIICFMGVMSQMKIWKIIRQKREERAQEQQRKEHERNLSDEEQGRKVEANNQQDRSLWEATHGRKSGTGVQERYLDSGIGTDEPSSTRKSSLGDVRDTETAGMELHEMSDPTKSTDENGRVTIHVAQDDFYETSLVGGQRTSLERNMLGSVAGPSTCAASEASSIKGAAKVTTIDPSLALKPKVVPPPFKIPSPESDSDEGGSSIVASVATDNVPRRGSKRLSGFSMNRKPSNPSRRSYIASDTSEEALMIPHVEDDQASSLAATQDGVSEHNGSEDMLDYSRSQTPVVEQVLDGESLEALEAVSLTKISNPDHLTNELPELPSSRPASMMVPEDDKCRNGKSLSHLDGPAQDARPIPLRGNLPEGGSKVVTAYRTNEWAKHLDAADVPDVEELKMHKKRAQEKPQAVEPAAPVDVKALQQTPLDAAPRPEPISNPSHQNLPSSKSRSSTLMSKNPFSRLSKQQSSPTESQPNIHPLAVAKGVERNPSQASLVNSVSRTSSQTSLDSAGRLGDNQRPSLPQRRTSQGSSPYINRGYRSSSTPLGSTPLLESPIEEGVESNFPKTRLTPHDSHLISQRDRIITSKPSSTSLLRTSYSNVALDQHPAFRSIEEDTDDIPLTRRKSMLQQNPEAVPLKHRSSVGASGATTPVQNRNNPYRSSSTSQVASSRPGLSQRDSTISAWHRSLKPDTTAHLENQNMEARRADLLREKQRESTSRLEGNIKSGVRNSVIDQGMRRGDMLNAHQAAMRKLQGEAKI
ncbi:hypothetical protein ACLMJK_009301 [Lecanora helva]